MTVGYQKGMISLHDIGHVAMLYEPSNFRKVFAEYETHLAEAENTPAYHQYFNNLKYLVHVSKSIVSVKDEDANRAVRIFLYDFIKDNFDEKYSYNWQELKSILFYCKYVSNLKTVKNFVQILKSPFFKSRLYLYLLNDSSLAERCWR